MPRRAKPLLHIDAAGTSSLSQASGYGSFVLPSIDRAAHHRIMQPLVASHFWGGKSPILGLWPHQKAAISHSIAYLCAETRISTEGDVREAALLKLPTGTGKSGIIAILSRCLPTVSRVLLLTPRKALTEQLIEDVKWRFWSNIKLAADSKRTWTATIRDTGINVEDAFIERVLPSNVEMLAKQLGGTAQRAVLVSTHQALDDVRRLSSRKPRTDGVQEPMFEFAQELIRQIRSFDLVVVDEGHYEPAPSWSRNIRGLDLPTILLSATPFRNDYKAFRVRGRFVYNFAYQEAVQSHIVRKVQFPGATARVRTVKTLTAPAVERAAEYDTKESVPLTAGDQVTVRAFVELIRQDMLPIMQAASKFTSVPKCIIRAATFEALELLQGSLKKEFHESVLLIHDRVPRDDLVAMKFHNVRAAIKVGARTRFWLHQSKLLEGIDDPSIVAIGVLHGFANTRQLVQQIGRAIRSTDPKRKVSQTAHIIALPTPLDEMYTRWQRYLKYEATSVDGIGDLVQAEGAMPDRMLRIMPDYQYVDGDFRAKYMLDGNVQSDDLRLSLRTSVFLVDADFDAKDAEVELEEALLARDRFVPRPVENLPPDMFGRTYYGWGNTPYLAEQYLAEWRLGVVLAARIGNYLFVQDTGGICFEAKKLRVRKAGREVLLKAFPDSADGKTTLTRISGNSLDMSDRSIRSQAYRTRSLESTFTDLSDPSFILSSAYGYVAGNGRYLGLARARLSDAGEAMMDPSAYRSWLQAVQETLDSATPRHRVFDRYAQVTTVDDDEAKPVSVLLDLASEAFQEFQIQGESDQGEAGHDVPYDDLCADVDPDSGKFKIRMRDGTYTDCTINYNSSTKRYRFQSPQLNALVPLRSRTGKPQTLSELVNREQNFRVLVSRSQVVYSGGSFYKAREFAANGKVFALEDAYVVPQLAHAVTEKGEALYKRHRQRWKEESIFGSVFDLCRQNHSRPLDELARRIKSLDTMLLDDGPNEIGDFVGLDRQLKRVVLVHAKASKGPHKDAVTELQAVGRQVISSLAFCSTQARVTGIQPSRWQKKVIANTVELKGLSRVFKCPSGEPFAETALAVLSALANPTYNKEIWIIAGRLLDIPYVRELVLDETRTSNRCRQLIMYISGLQTACQRAGAHLRIFAHEDAPVI